MTLEEQNAILAEMRQTLSSPAYWTQDALARSPDGDIVDIEAPNALCFCVLGAYTLAARRVCGTSDDSWFYHRHRDRLHTWSGDIAGWNDHPATTYEDVLAFLEE